MVKWIAIVAGGVVLVVAAIVAAGSMLPRNHKASRTLRLKRPPADVWPVLIAATEASDVPVDVLERDPRDDGRNAEKGRRRSQRRGRSVRAVN